MNYYGALLLIIVALGTIAYTLYFLYRRRFQTKLIWIDTLPLSADQAAILMTLPHYRCLSSIERTQIERNILRFIHTKNFEGIDLEITDEIRFIVAFYACLLLMNKNAPIPYPEITTILIYPDAVLYEQQRNDGGIVTEEVAEIDGQAGDGIVVITWDAAYEEATKQQEANLILHEFAHVIDAMDGEIDGIPPLQHSQTKAWLKTFDPVFDELDRRVLSGSELEEFDLFGEDAATDEAELFAVATERFFGVPVKFSESFPQLYARFTEFYGFDAARKFTANILKSDQLNRSR